MEKPDVFEQWDGSPTRGSPTTRKSNITEQEDSTSPPRHSSADPNRPQRKKRGSFVTRQQGKPYLGMTTAEKVDEVTQKKYIVVTSVDMGSLSCLAGINEGDTLMTWQTEGDTTERQITTHEELIGAYNSANVGDKVNLFVKKGSGKTVVCRIDFGIKDLRMELEELKLLLERRESDCAQYILDMSVMSTSIDTLKTQNKDLQITIEKLKLVAESETVYIKEVTEIKSKYEDLRSEFESYRRKIEAQLLEESSSCKAAIKQRELLQTQLDNLLKEREKGDGKFKSRISEMETELTTLRQQLSGSTKERTTLKDQLQALQDEHQSYRKSIELKLKDEASRSGNLDSELAKLKRALDLANANVTDLEGRLQDSQHKYNLLDKVKADLQKQLAELQSEFGAHKKQADANLREAQAVSEERAAEIDRMKKQISKLESQHKHALAELQLKLESVSQQYSTSEKNRNDITLQLTVLNEEFNTYKKQMEAKLRDASGKAHELELELDSLRKSFGRQESSLKDRIKELEEQVESVRGQYTQSQKVNIEIQGQLSALQEELASSKKQWEARWRDEVQKGQDLERELEKVKKLSSQREGQLSDRIKELEQSVDSLRAQLGSSEKARNELANQLSGVQSEFSDARKQWDAKLKQEQSKVEALEAEIERLSKLEYQYRESSLQLELQVTTLKSQVQILEKSKSELEQLLDAANAEKRLLEMRIRELTQSLNDSHTENEKLNAALHTSTLKIKTLTKNLEDSEAANNELKDTVKTAKKQVSDMGDEIATLTAKIEALLAQLKAQAHEANEEIQSKEALIRELRQRVQQLTSSLDSANSKIIPLEAENAQLKRTNQSLQSEFAEMELRIDDLANKNRILKGENINLAARYAELEECLKNERIVKNELIERSKQLNDELLDLKERFARQIQQDSQRNNSELSATIEKLQSELNEHRMVINNFGEKEKTLISQYEYLLLTCKQENEGLELIIKTQKIEIDKFSEEVQLLKLQGQSLGEFRKQIELKDNENLSLQQTLVISVEKQLILQQQLTDLRLRVEGVTCSHSALEVVHHEVKESTEIEDFRLIISILEKLFAKITSTSILQIYPILRNECFQLRLAFERVETHLLSYFNSPHYVFGAYRDNYSIANYSF